MKYLLFFFALVVGCTAQAQFGLEIHPLVAPILAGLPVGGTGPNYDVHGDEWVVVGYGNDSWMIDADSMFFYGGIAFYGYTIQMGNGAYGLTGNNYIPDQPDGVAANFDGLDSNASVNGTDFLAELKQIRLYAWYACRCLGLGLGLGLAALTIQGFRGWINV